MELEMIWKDENFLGDKLTLKEKMHVVMHMNENIFMDEEMTPGLWACAAQFQKFSSWQTHNCL